MFEYPVEINSSFEIIGNGINTFKKRSRMENRIFANILINKNEKIELRPFLGKDYKLINKRTPIYSKLKRKTKIQLAKDTPVEVQGETAGWLRIKFYPEKEGEWTGETIEGWIKKTDVK